VNFFQLKAAHTCVQVGLTSMIKLMPVGYQVTSRVAALRCVTGQFV